MIRLAPLILLALAACNADSTIPQSKPVRRPDWSLAGPDGKKVSAADFDGKVVVLNFWATWCPPCVAEIPGFIEIQKRHAAKGFTFIGFSFDQDADTHDRWVKAKQVNYPSLFAMTDEGKKVVEAFEKAAGAVEVYPTTFVIDRQGNIVARHEGYLSEPALEKFLAKLF